MHVTRDEKRWRRCISQLCLCLFLCVCITGSVAAQVNLKSQVDRTRVTVYDRFNYTLTLESGSRNMPEPKAPDFKGFKLIGVPRTSTQFSWMNGKVSNTKVYTYGLQATKEGTFTIGPASVTIDGKIYQSTPVKITVVKPEQAVSNENNGQTAAKVDPQKMGNLFIRAVVDEDSPYVGQAVRVSYYLYTRVRVRDYGFAEQPDYSGFWMEQVDLPEQPALNTRTINGVEFGEAKIYEVILYPTMTGELTVEPLNMVFEIQSRQRDPMDDFFNSPFRSSFFGTRRESRSSQALSLNVRPLPVDGQPDGFSGAVGQYSLNGEINTTSVKTGEAVVVRVTVSGEYGLETLKPPVAPSLESFKLFEPKSEDVKPDSKRPGWQQQTWEYILVPHRAGAFTIPAFTFSCFDPDKQSYETLKTPEFDIHVEAMPNSGVTIQQGSDGEVIQLLNVDIRYIKTGNHVSLWSAPYLASWFIAVMVMPVLIVPGAYLLIRYRRRLEGDSQFAREIRARSESGRRFSKAIGKLGNGDISGALDDAAAAFSRYLSDRLGLPTGGVTLRIVMDELKRREVSEDLGGKVKKYWDDLELLRYAPMEAREDAVREVLSQGQDLVSILDKAKIKRRQSRKRAGKGDGR